MTEALDPATFAEGDFWRFSLAFYAREGLPAACLHLQDSHGLDVNIVLFCLWAGIRGQRLEADELVSIAGEAALWQRQAVAPLRQVRRWLKMQETAEEPKVARLRQAIKEQELRAEAIEQERLSRHVTGDGTADAQIARDNMRAYLEIQGVAYDNGVKQIINSMINLCF